MRRAFQQFWLVAAFIFTVQLTTALPARAAFVRTGEPAPAFSVTTLDGRPLSLDTYRGKVLAIDFFATWCQPCKASIPHLNGLVANYSRQGLHILGLSVEDDGEKGVRVFAERNGITYPVALAGENMLADFGVRSVPVLIVIDRKGRIAEVFRGYGPQVIKSAEQLIKKLLAEK